MAIPESASHRRASTILVRTAGLEPACLHIRNVPLIQLSYVRVIGFRPRIRTALLRLTAGRPHRDGSTEKLVAETIAGLSP
jgi:hypothetical protein